MSDADARTLRDFLRDHVRELQLEIARTDRKAFRHTLIERQEVIERLLRDLEQPEVATRA